MPATRPGFKARKKDVIISGGETICSVDVEIAISSIPRPARRSGRPSRREIQKFLLRERAKAL
jgi:hypothetical protein